MMLGLPAACIPVLLVSLLLGTPILSLLGAVGAALTVGLKRGGLLLALLILPLYIPVLILGSGALQASLQGLPAVGHLLWLRSEEHTSELQSLMRISYAVFCLKKNKQHTLPSHLQ